MVKKVERDGKIGVLISRGYGAGWSTWCGIPDKAEEMVFSPEIIELVERGAGEKEIIQKAEELFGTDGYYGGVDGLTVIWVEKHKVFRISEYDGAEDIEFFSPDNYYEA